LKPFSLNILWPQKGPKDDRLFAAFEKSPTRKMTGRSCLIRLWRIGKELLFDPAFRRESSIPSMNDPAFSGDFS
jgi:hypothetical protein